MANAKSSFDRLHEAGVIAGDRFSESDKKMVEMITPDEVEVLIKLHKKMGHVPAGKDHLRPNIPV